VTLARQLVSPKSPLSDSAYVRLIRSTTCRGTPDYDETVSDVEKATVCSITCSVDVKIIPRTKQLQSNASPNEPIKPAVR